MPNTDLTDAPEWVDDVFEVVEEPWGTWVSKDKDGTKLITSLSKEMCVSATRFYLKGKQEGFPDSAASYDGVVGGKL